MWARRHRVQFVGLPFLVAVVVVLFWFSPVLAALLALGVVGAGFAVGLAVFASRYGRNPYDDTPRKRRSGPWEGPR